MNDRESRTAFQHVANIGCKNVYRIFAGGNHSWVVIDDIVPVKRKYRPPSPVPDNKAMLIHGQTQQPQRSNSRGPTTSKSTLEPAVSKQIKPEPSFSSVNLGNARPSAIEKRSSRNFEISITVQASGGARDTQMCHRFVNFETSDVSEDIVSGQLQEYLRILK